MKTYNCANMSDWPNYVTDLQPSAKLTPLEKLAWAELSDEEWLDRVAPEVWKARVIRQPSGYTSFGMCGVTSGRVKVYISTYGSHFRGRKRQEIQELLYERASNLLHEQCCEWALESFRRANFSVLGLQQAVSSVVPEGCRRLVLETFSASLASCWEEIRDALESRKHRPIK